MSLVGKVALGALGVLVLVRVLLRRRGSRQAPAKAPAVKPKDSQQAKVRYGCCAHIGNRSYMEDFQFAMAERQRGFFVVCDGHGGQDAARFTTENLLHHFLLGPNLVQGVGCALTDAFLKVDRQFQKEVAAGKQQPSGTTALAAVVLKDKAVVANAGDCRCILSRSGMAVDITEEHRPESPKEKHRIEAAGGFLDQEGYLNGQLGVSRAIGDHHLLELKSPGGTGPLIADPEVAEVTIGDEEEFMVLASDGLWMSSQTIVSIVRSNLRTHNCPVQAAEEVVKVALNDPSSKDNITVTVVCFKKIPPPPRPAGGNRNSRLKINRS